MTLWPGGPPQHIQTVNYCHPESFGESPGSLRRAGSVADLEVFVGKYPLGSRYAGFPFVCRFCEGKGFSCVLFLYLFCEFHQAL